MATDPSAVEFFTDPRRFLTQASGYLASDPVVNTVMATATARLALRLDEDGDLPELGYEPWWALVREHEGPVAGVAMRTAPLPLAPMFVLPMPEQGAKGLARLVHARGENPGGVNGTLPTARLIADTLAGLTGMSASTLMHTRLFELGSLRMPTAPPGYLRLARTDEAQLVLAWFKAFAEEAAEQGGRTLEPGHSYHVGLDDILERISEGGVWVWIDIAGRPVHLTMANPPSFGARRIGPVYTPKGHRGHGYASAAVAEVSRQLLDNGHRGCLYTDQANPTSNAVYLRLGYRPVMDMANLVIR